MIMNDDFPYLGTGWSFPPVFNKATKEVLMTEGFEDLNKSLEIIITTKLGERIMRPKFGCNLESTLFESMDYAAIAFLENMIRTAILYHEARIDVDAIQLDFEAPKGILWIRIVYRVRNANSRFNFVYPYYLEEANSII